MGANYSRNRGINYSHGEYIAFLDDDDEWRLEKLEVQLNEIIKSTNIGLVYADYFKYDLEGNKEQCYKVHRRGIVFKELLSHNIIGVTSNVLIRRECFEKCGLFDEKLCARQDYDLWLRICQKYEAFHVKKFLLNYYTSEVSISSNINNRIQGRNAILVKYKDSYAENPEAYLSALLEYYYELLYNEKYYLGLKVLFKAIKHSPLSILCLRGCRDMFRFIIWGKVEYFERY